MSRRKRESIGLANERDFPHVVDEPRQLSILRGSGTKDARARGGSLARQNSTPATGRFSRSEPPPQRHQHRLCAG
jgi:hypothetical protein